MVYVINHAHLLCQHLLQGSDVNITISCLWNDVNLHTKALLGLQQ